MEDKITIPTEKWVELCRYPSYVLEYSSLDPITRLNQMEMKFIQKKSKTNTIIVGDVEDILRTFLLRSNHE